MKTLSQYLESLLDDEDDLISNNDILIHQFLKDNYKIKGTYTIKDGVVDVNGDIALTNNKLEYLTNEFFVFGKISGLFIAGDDRKINIKSLKGSPKEAGIFAVNRSKITSLEGCPEIAEYCNFEYNSELLNLKGSPKTLKGSFMCYGCEKLKSLKGAPKKIGGSFDLSGCIEISKDDIEKEKSNISCKDIFMF